MVLMLCPVFSAAANTLVLRQPTPHALIPTVVVTLGGAAAVIAGQMQQNEEAAAGGGASVPTAGQLAGGCVLALASCLFLTAYLVLIQARWGGGL